MNTIEKLYNGGYDLSQYNQQQIDFIRGIAKMAYNEGLDNADPDPMEQVVKNAVKEALREHDRVYIELKKPAQPTGYVILIKDDERYFVEMPEGFEYPQTTNLLSFAKVFTSESEAYEIINKCRALRFLGGVQCAMPMKYVESMVVQDLY